MVAVADERRDHKCRNRAPTPSFLVDDISIGIVLPRMVHL
jgi:hypothetical protein